MKKLKIVLLVMVSMLLVSCEDEDSVKSDLELLQQERTELQSEIVNLTNKKITKNKEIISLDKQLKELKIYESGRVPQYILKFHLKQSHVSLDIGKHVKDAMNAIDFELPVSKEFYNTVDVGDRIVDDFRNGSFILNGSIGKWKMTVVDKEIR